MTGAFQGQSEAWLHDEAKPETHLRWSRLATWDERGSQLRASGAV